MAQNTSKLEFIMKMSKLVLNCFRQQELPVEGGDQAGKHRAPQGRQTPSVLGDSWGIRSTTANTGSFS